ncbi:MAG: DUF2023 family protein [Draconibacterium sp.]
MLQSRNFNIRSADLQILTHHIYEYKKGVRNMVLHTIGRNESKEAELILKSRSICYHIQKVNTNKVNIFFGNADCVELIKSFGDISLSNYTPEQDFILGIMPGYNRDLRCRRYLQKKGKETFFPKPCIV